MLHDLDKTLEDLLIKEGNIRKSDIDISFEQPNSEWSARLSRPTINCWCFDMRENLKLRGTGLSTTRDVNGGNFARTTMPQSRFDLTYLITAWARKVEDEHQLLWRALGTLKRFSSISPERAEGALRYQTRDMPCAVGSMSDLPFNLSDLWSVLDNQMRLGFTAAITVELDLDMGFDSPLVLEAGITVGQSPEPRTRELSVEDVTIQHPKKREEGKGDT